MRNGKRYEKMVFGRVARVFAEESRATEQSNSREECGCIFQTAFLLFAGYVGASTTFAQNCGGGGFAPDQNWGHDKNEDDILWAHLILVGNIYKEVMAPNFIAKISGHVENSRAFNRYREIDLGMKQDLVRILENKK